MELLGKYRNGNTDVSIMRDGTRICETNDDEFDFAFPMSMDVTITTKCDGGCREAAHVTNGSISACDPCFNENL